MGTPQTVYVVTAPPSEAKLLETLKEKRGPKNHHAEYPLLGTTALVADIYSSKGQPIKTAYTMTLGFAAKSPEEIADSQNANVVILPNFRRLV